MCCCCTMGTHKALIDAILRKAKYIMKNWKVKYIKLNENGYTIK